MVGRDIKGYKVTGKYFCIFVTGTQFPYVPIDTKFFYVHYWCRSTRENRITTVESFCPSHPMSTVVVVLIFVLLKF